MSRTQDGEIGKIKRKISKRNNIKRKIRPKTKQCNFNKYKWNKVIYCQEKNINSKKLYYKKLIKLKHLQQRQQNENKKKAWTVILILE